MAGYRSHSMEDIRAALARGEEVWALDTGNAGEDDTLIGSRDAVVADILHHHELDAWPAGWTLDRVQESESLGWLTLTEAGARWGQKPDTLRKKLNRGRLVGQRRGRDWFISTEAMTAAYGPEPTER